MRPGSAFCLSATLETRMLIPKLQFLYLSGTENQEKENLKQEGVKHSD